MSIPTNENIILSNDNNHIGFRDNKYSSKKVIAYYDDLKGLSKPCLEMIQNFENINEYKDYNKKNLKNYESEELRKYKTKKSQFDIFRNNVGNIYNETNNSYNNSIKFNNKNIILSKGSIKSNCSNVMNHKSKINRSGKFTIFETRNIDFKRNSRYNQNDERRNILVYYIISILQFNKIAIKFSLFKMIVASFIYF